MLNYLLEIQGKDGIVGEMKYNNSFINRIKIEKLNGKFWLVVYFENGTRWTPALMEQGLIAQKVALCEKLKYKNLKWPAEKMPSQFIVRAMKGEEVCALAHEFKLTHTRAYKHFCLRNNNDKEKS